MTSLADLADRLARHDQNIIISCDTRGNLSASLGLIVEMTENNSGGTYLLNDDDRAKLIAAGWSGSLGVGWNRNTWYVIASSVDHAQAMFRDITGYDPNYCTCSCCGQDFYWMVADADDMFGDTNND